MTILSFRKARENKPAPAGGWDQSEIADFYRAHRLLTDQGICFGIDQGVSDDGDPWFVFFDFDTHDVFLHLARFDGRCILVCEQLGLDLTAHSVSDVVRRFEDAVRDLVDVRRRSGNVIAHPATRIITSLSVVFLLFKLDNIGANAGTTAGKDEKDGPLAGDWTGLSRLSELQAQLAQRGTLARLFDGADSPMGAALLAGLVMSTAIADATLSEAGPDSDDAEAVALLTEDGQPVETETAEQVAAAAAAAVEAQQAAQAPQHEAPLTAEGAPAPDIGAVDIAVHEQPAAAKKPAAAEPEADPDAEAARELAFLDGAPAPKRAAPAATEAVEEEEAPVSQQTVTEVPSDLEEETAETGLDVKLETSDVETADHLAGTSAAEDAPKLEIAGSFKLKSLIEEQFGLSSNELEALFSGTRPDTTVETETVSLDPLAEATDDTPLVHDLTLDSLDAFSADAGRTIVTKLGTTDIKEVFRIVLEKFEGYELQYKNGDLLIEQANLDGTKAQDVTIWTNVMADGSEISFVGVLDLGDAAAAYIA